MARNKNVYASYKPLYETLKKDIPEIEGVINVDI